MKVAWVNRSFLDYRVPVYAELDRLLGGKLWVLYSKEQTPERVQEKISHAIGDRAVGFERERTLFRMGRQETDFANEYGEILYQPGLVTKLRGIRPDVLIGEGFFRWTAGAVAYRMMTGTPLVISYERTRHTERGVQWYRTMYRRFVLHWTNAVCCNGRLSKEYVTSLGMPGARIITGAMAADSGILAERCASLPVEEIQDFRRKYSGEGLLFLYVGQLVERKGVRPLLEAWNRFISRSHNNGGHRLLLVGAGPLEVSLKETIQSAGMNSVHFLGPVDYDSIHLYYGACDVLVMPTLEDNWSLVVPEAMACGLPIMCSRYNGCYPELVKDGWNGRIFDPVDENDTVACLEWFATQQGRLEKMGENSKVLQEDYSPATAGVAYHDACAMALDWNQSPRNQNSQVDGNRVAIISNCPAPYRRDFFKALGADEKLHTRVLYCSHSRPDVAWGDYEENEYEHEFLGGMSLSSPGGGIRYLTPSLFTRLARFRPDAVVAVGVSLESLISLFYSRLRNVPFLVWWAGTRTSAAGLGSIRSGYRRWFFRHVSGFLCYSQLGRDYLESTGVSVDKAVVLGNNTLDAEAFRAWVDNLRISPSSNTPLRCLAIGQIIDRKNLETVLTALEKVRIKGCQALLTIVGDGPAKEKIETMALSKGLGNVRFVGMKGPEEIAQFYASHDLLISIAKVDRWPQVVNEAMAAGLPVIISSTSGVDEDFVRDGENGFVISPDDSGALSQILCSLAEDRTRLVEMGDMAYETAKENDCKKALRVFKETIERHLVAGAGPARQTV